MLASTSRQAMVGILGPNLGNQCANGLLNEAAEFTKPKSEYANSLSQITSYIKCSFILKTNCYSRY